MPQYGPAGWLQWPDHPAASAQFARVLAAAQQGAATVSECFLAASCIRPGDPLSWFREWTLLAEANRERAEVARRAGRTATAQANLLRAAAYHRASELILPLEAVEREAAFTQAIACSRDWLRLATPAGAAVAITARDGSVVDAYFLHPGGAEPAPAIVCFGGLDGHKDELLPRLWPQARERGLALLLVDLPGQGETLRTRGLVARIDVEVPVSACVDWLAERRDLDPSRIALYGASLGGVYAARAASREHRLRALVSDSCIFDLELHLAQRLAVDRGVGWDLLLQVFGCAQPRDVIDRVQGLRMESLVRDIACPYLIVQGEHDFLGLQTARDAYDFARAAGVDAQFKVFTARETGASHCQADNPTLGQEFIADWLMERLRPTA